MIEIKANNAQCCQGNHTKQCIMLSGTSNQTMHNVIRKIIPNDAQYYQGNQTKLCIMLSKKSDQTMHNIIKEIKPKVA